MACAALQSDPAVRARFDGFVASMVYGPAAGFDDAMRVVSALVDAAWPQVEGVQSFV